MTSSNIILSSSCYDLLNHFVITNSSSNNFSVKKLTTELRTAKVVENDKVPKKVVQLNSKIKLKIQGNNKAMEVKLVMPKEANIKENKISIYSPMGAALIGYQKDDEITWEVPAGLKTIQILDVEN